MNQWQQEGVENRKRIPKHKTHDSVAMATETQSKQGEIMIMTDSNTLLFFEMKCVKSREKKYKEKNKTDAVETEFF